MPRNCLFQQIYPQVPLSKNASKIITISYSTQRWQEADFNKSLSKFYESC
uniref:Uncharacterized protein n=1 Tax=Rhizophora mucronata TaxID=61149 RepID=A0A2P2Q436_RHIMU